jgi:biopolymer transport protein ExbD
VSAVITTLSLDAPMRLAPRPRRRDVKRRARNILILNLTPLLDCVFMLLLFLIVATRFTTPEGFLAANLPAQASASVGFDVPRTPIRLYIARAAAPTESVSVRIDNPNGAIVLRDQVQAALLARLETPGYDQRTPVYIIAADNVTWDDVVNVYNAALAAKFDRIYFIED